MLRAIYRSLPCTILLGSLGGLVSALLIVSWPGGNTGSFSFRVLRVSAWLGLQVFDHLYEGFPVIASTVVPNALLVFFAIFQWSLLGVVLDVAGRWVSVRGRSRRAA